MKNNLKNFKKIHFIGIGGISMSALASVLLSRGFKVSGSDSSESKLTKSLKEEGAEIAIGQRASNITEDIDLVVFSAAIKPDNPEYERSSELNIPLMSRADFLGTLMKDYGKSICISGTHGKTTTTSMISEIMIHSNVDPTIMVGGILPSINGNLRIGHSDTFITEACEYANSFLSFFPTTAVITNVSADHLDFFKDLDDIRLSFHKFAHLLPKDGTLVINGEIENSDYFTEGLDARIITFGLHGDFNFTAKNISYNNLACAEYDIYKDGKFEYHAELKIPGEYNVYNSLAAVAAANSCGIPISDAVTSVCAFKGVDRRFQIKGDFKGVTVIDDYAHHPEEIKSTLTAAKHYPHKKLWVVFQPHTYSRTQAFLDDFAESLSIADAVVLAEIYAAREKNTIGISSRDIEVRLKKKNKECHYFSTFSEIENFLLENCKHGDVLITMGAGDVTEIGDFLLGE